MYIIKYSICFTVHVVEKLYVVGGSDGQTSLVSVEIFDFTTCSWSPGPNLGTPRANMGVAVIHQRLFAVGGFSGKAFLNSVEFLSEDDDQWCAYQPADVTAADRGKLVMKDPVQYCNSSG